MYEIIKHSLNHQQFLHQWEQCPGLIPIGIELEQQQLVWRDMGHYHPYEGFFRKTLQSFNTMQTQMNRRSQVDYFTTDIKVLHDDAVVRDSLYPSGFIFHMGRCGSTLLVKALSQSRSNLVISEAAPHNLIWPYLGGEQIASIEKSVTNLTLYRNLILAMGRKRRPEYQYHFIKFTSFDILFFDFIRAAFPSVPALFIYRDPVEVLASLLKKEASWLAHKDSAWGHFIMGKELNANCSTETFFSNALQHSMLTALQSETQGLRYLNYQQLTVDNLPTILTALNISYTDKDLVQAQNEFTRYSKADYRCIPFQSDNVQKQQVLSSENSTLMSQQLHPLYTRLVQSSRNIVSDRSSLKLNAQAHAH